MENSDTSISVEEKKQKYFFLDEADFDEWWNNVNIGVQKKSFGEQEEDIFKYSVSLKSFRSEYETDSLLTPNIIKLLKSGKLEVNKKPTTSFLQKKSLQVLIPGYNPNSFIPNTSRLSYNEMILCLRIIEAGKPQSPEELAVWKECKEKLEDEQNYYMEFAKEQWLADGSTKHNVIKPHIKELVDSLWKVRLERVKKYPKFYVQKENISLLTSGEMVELKFNKQLESIGRPSHYFMPDLWVFNVNTNTAFNFINKPTFGWSQQKDELNACYKQIHQKLINKGYQNEVSKDVVALQLAKENNVNIVMSSSAFTNLIDTQASGMNSVWNLPVTIIEYQSDHGIKKVAFIDKKLPPLTMTAVERIKYYSKLALKKLFIRPSKNYRELSVGIYDADSLETFGVDGPTKKVSFLTKRKKSICDFCKQNKSNDDEKTLLTEKELINIENSTTKNDFYDSDDSSNFYIDAGDEQTQENPTAENDKNLPATDNVNSKKKNCFCTYEWIEEDLNSTGKGKKRLTYRVVYNLWDFNSLESQNVMSKNYSKNLKVIIRTTLEGQLTDKIEKTQKLYYKLSPKLEYQTEFGAEAATASEVLREWAAIHIRPSTCLARVRLDGLSGELIQLQTFKSSNDLSKECQRLYNVNPKNRLVTMHSILDKLTDLPAGNYLLNRNPQTGPFVNLCQSVERGGSHTFNLHLQFAMVEPSSISPQRSPFPPLDPLVITPTFKHFKRVPCTFVPKKFRTKCSLLKDNTAVNPPVVRVKRKKKKKKRKIT